MSTLNLWMTVFMSGDVCLSVRVTFIIQHISVWASTGLLQSWIWCDIMRAEGSWTQRCFDLHYTTVFIAEEENDCNMGSLVGHLRCQKLLELSQNAFSSYMSFSKTVTRALYNNTKQSKLSTEVANRYELKHITIFLVKITSGRWLWYKSCNITTMETFTKKLDQCSR